MGIDVHEFVPELPDDHIALQAARLRVAASAALPAVATHAQRMQTGQAKSSPTPTVLTPTTRQTKSMNIPPPTEA